MKEDIQHTHETYIQVFAVGPQYRPKMSVSQGLVWFSEASAGSQPGTGSAREARAAPVQQGHVTGCNNNKGELLRARAKKIAALRAQKSELPLSVAWVMAGVFFSLQLSSRRRLTTARRRRGAAWNETMSYAHHRQMMRNNFHRSRSVCRRSRAAPGLLSA